MVIMINTIYIIGILFIILGFVLLLLATTEVRKINKEIIKQEQLHKSYIKAKQNEKNIFNYKHTILNYLWKGKVW